MQDTTITGIEILDEKEKKIADKLISEYFLKIKRMIKNETSLKIFVKEYEKEGRGKKYSINAEVISTKIFKATASDWDFARTLHKVLNKILHEIEHKFHTSEQR